MNERMPSGSRRVKVGAVLGALVGVGVGLLITKNTDPDFTEMTMTALVGGFAGSIILGVGASMLDDQQPPQTQRQENQDLK